jgi:hypothetical protein
MRCHSNQTGRTDNRLFQPSHTAFSHEETRLMVRSETTALTRGTTFILLVNIWKAHLRAQNKINWKSQLIRYHICIIFRRSRVQISDTVFVAFIRFFTQMPRKCIKLGHDRFHSHAFQFTVLLLSCKSRCKVGATKRTVKWTTGLNKISVTH